MSIKVENNNGILSVVIPPEYKEPNWLGYMYMNRYTTREDGSIVIPCQWEYARAFCEGQAEVKDVDGEWYPIDKTGKRL